VKTDSSGDSARLVAESQMEVVRIIAIEKNLDLYIFILGRKKEITG
jgi:hypothetical protein